MLPRRRWRSTAVQAAWVQSVATAESLVPLAWTRRARGTSDLLWCVPVRFAGWGPGGMGVEGGSCEHSDGISAIRIALVDASVVREQCVVDICYHLTVCFALSRHGSLWYLLFTAKYVIFHRSSIAALSWTTKVQQSTSARYAPPAACMRGTTDPLCHTEPFITLLQRVSCATSLSMAAVRHSVLYLPVTQSKIIKAGFVKKNQKVGITTLEW